MTDMRAAATWRVPSSAATVAAVAVVAVLVTVAIRPAAGLYLVDGTALVLSLAAAGCALFSAVFPVPAEYVNRWRRAVHVLALTAFAATLLTVVAALADVAGSGLQGLADTTAGDAVLRGGIYQAAVVRCVGLCGVVLAFSLPRPRRLLLVAAAVVTSGSFLLTGHVRSHGPAAVVVACALAHVVAVAAWLGGLAGVALVTRSRDARTDSRMLTQFAAVMTGVVMMLLAGGVGLAVLYLPSPSALVTSSYGQVLLVKTGLVAGALVASAANHRWLVPMAARGERRALAVLRMNIAVEQVALLTVLMITEILMRQNPAGA